MRRIGLAGLGLATLAAALVWRCHGGAPTAPAPPGPHAALAAPHRDPRTLPRASLAGTVRDDAGAAVAGARVCARGTSSAIPTGATLAGSCVVASSAGVYRIDGLVPMTYGVAAMAAGFQPAIREGVAATMGQAVTGIDVVLLRGAVQVTGTVSDVSGGPIAHALVAPRVGNDTSLHANAGVAVETDDKGRFALWARPGTMDIEAAADGYAPTLDLVIAPGSIDLFLMPESTLSGTVVDAASGTPIEGARIVAERANFADDPIDISDAGGHFHFGRLPPQRYTLTAHVPHGYGQASSVLLGLGTRVDDVVVRVFPAFHVDGRVLAGSTPCAEPRVMLADDTDHRWIALERAGDGMASDELPPASYRADVRCPGFDSHDHYDPVVLVDRDLHGIVWQTDPGADIRGRVLDSSGAPVPRATIAVSSGFERFAQTESAGDGSYALRGLRAGSYLLWCTSDRGAFSEAGISIEAPATRDLVLEATGAIGGTVTDTDGHAVAHVLVSAAPAHGRSQSAQTDDTGAFTIANLRPGDYAVAARLLPASAHATVTATQTATVHLVVAPETGTIRGSVVDSAGRPVADAFVDVAADSERGGGRPIKNDFRWSWDARPVVTAADGAFTVEQLATGTYTVRAHRKGGGEALAEHVAVGSTVRLEIKPTGSIEGVVRPGNDIALTISDPVRHEERTEQLFHTEGRFALRDLPAGHYVLVAAASTSKRSLELDLADGEHRTGIVIALASQVTLTGRIVDAKTKQPIAGAGVLATSPTDLSSMRFGRQQPVLTDATGRFTIEGQERGEVLVGAWAGDLSTGNDLKRTIALDAPSPYDLGDIGLIRLHHLKRGDPIGQLGAKLDGARVVSVEAQGAAAKAGLVVGDVLITIEGYDVGDNVQRLLRAPPGTKLALGLARGVTVTVTLAAP